MGPHAVVFAHIVALATEGVLAASPAAVAQKSRAAWADWLARFGHDDYLYPEWISSQMAQCTCEMAGSMVQCRESGRAIDWSESADLTWCAAKHFLLSYMPEFDRHFLPGSVSVDGISMLDDNIAFALMAWNASSLDPRPPIKAAYVYLLPYATYHEARANWRPLFFAKYFNEVAGLRKSRDIVDALIGGGVRMMSWAAYKWPGYPGTSPHNSYDLGPFASGSTPPVIAPFDFTAYGYGSCTGWAKFLASALKAVGVPAREVGTPCWNTIEFAGLARDNPNVSMCWKGKSGRVAGGKFLNNHQWVEYWDNVDGEWRFTDVATSSSAQSTWFCSSYSNGCGCSSPAGKASQDHEILAATWAIPGSTEEDSLHGGPVLNVATDLLLSSGEAVSPLVWSPSLRSPLGTPLKDVGLRVVNRTAFYRCKPTVTLRQ